MKISTISVRFIFNVFVNCYLIEVDDGYFLVDTGMPGKRRFIEKKLEILGCTPDSLRLIILTHGDKDHIGNAAYLGRRFKAKIAMHRDDSGMAEFGNMFWNRKPPNPLMRWIAGQFLGLSMSDRFKPDIYIAGGDDLSGYGFNARVVHIPGHSSGSIGILTADGDLFCGDLLANTSKPGLWSIIDDAAAAEASVHKLRNLGIKTVYPGHGEPFVLESLPE